MRLALLGDPVEHSLSPRLHAAAFTAVGIDGTYETRRVGPPDMRMMADEVRQGRLDGANITMPHKVLAAELADHLDQTATRAGSVNTWVRRDGNLVGHSTDGHGIHFAIHHGKLPKACPVLILGAGGAAAAAVDALYDRPLYLSSRRSEAAATLIETMGVDAEIVPWGTPLEGALVVNATPLGMRGESLPTGVVELAKGLLDMVYGETMTPAVAMAMGIGIPASNGLAMLVGQARESFRLWTGLVVPAGVMLEAANLSSDSAYGPKKHTNNPSGVEPCR